MNAAVDELEDFEVETLRLSDIPKQPASESERIRTSKNQKRSSGKNLPVQLKVLSSDS